MKKRKLDGLVLGKKTVSDLSNTVQAVIGGATRYCSGTSGNNHTCGSVETTWANSTNSICINNCTATWMNCE